MKLPNLKIFSFLTIERGCKKGVIDEQEEVMFELLMKTDSLQCSIYRRIYNDVLYKR